MQQWTWSRGAGISEEFSRYGDISFRRFFEQLEFLNALDTYAKRIVSDLNCTAIIAANDFTAVCCHDALRRLGVSVPDRISLVSFDDSIYSERARISSYNFNRRQSIQAAMNFLMFPQVPQSGSPIEVEGFLSFRDSFLRPVGREREN